MKEIPFSIPVSGVVRLDGGSIVIVVNRAETSIRLNFEALPPRRPILEEGVTVYDVILETAREVIRRKGSNRFRAPDLFYTALEKYPDLKRNSFLSRVIACTPNHPSYKHHVSRRDYFSRIGPGLYQPSDRYMGDITSDGQRTLFSQ